MADDVKFKIIFIVPGFWRALLQALAMFLSKFAKTNISSFTHTLPGVKKYFKLAVMSQIEANEKN